MSQFQIQSHSTEQSKYQFVRSLTKTNGVKKFQKGGYASVYSAKDKTDCFKVGEFDYKDPWSDGYLNFVAQIQEKQDNPFFPKIYAVNFYHNRETNTSWYCIHMEKLKALPKDYKRKQYLSNFSGMAVKSLMLANQKSLKELIDFVGLLEGKGAPAEQIKETCETLIQGGEKFTLDLHHFNLMRRDSQLVVLDPYSSKKQNAIK